MIPPVLFYLYNPSLFWVGVKTCENDEILFYSVQQKWGIWMDIIYLYKLFKIETVCFPAGYRKGKLHHSLLVDTGAMWQEIQGLQKFRPPAYNQWSSDT